MIQTKLGVGDLKLHVQADAGGSMCCSSVACCVTNQVIHEDLVKLDVEEDAEGEVEVSDSTEIIYVEESVGMVKRAYLRPFTQGDAKGVLKRKQKDAKIKLTLVKFYDKLVEEFGTRFAAIVSAWKEVNFTDMLQHAFPLRVSHILAISEGITLLSAPKTKEVFFHVIELCEKLADETELIDTIKKYDPKLKEEKTDTIPFLEKKKTSISGSIDASSNTIIQVFEKIIGHKENKEPTILTEEQMPNHINSLREQFFSISEKKGIMSLNDAKSIGNKLASLKRVKENELKDTKKSLHELSKGFFHVTREDAEKIIRLTVHLEATIDKVNENSENLNQSQQLPKIIDKFAMIPIQSSFKSTAMNRADAMDEEQPKKRSSHLPALREITECMQRLSLTVKEDKN